MTSVDRIVAIELVSTAVRKAVSPPVEEELSISSVYLAALATTKLKANVKNGDQRDEAATTTNGAVNVSSTPSQKDALQPSRTPAPAPKDPPAPTPKSTWKPPPPPPPGTPPQLPDYCWLVPEMRQQSQHPGNGPHPHGMLVGDNLIAEVYDAIRSNDALWKETLLVITYDEAGGYWDSKPCKERVPAPDAHASTPFDRSWAPKDGSPFNFEWLGPRVPCVLVSAWLDHAALPAFLKRLWGLSSNGPDGFLTLRDATAADLLGKLKWRDTPRSDLPQAPRNKLPVGPPGKEEVGYPGPLTSRR